MLSINKIELMERFMANLLQTPLPVLDNDILRTFVAISTLSRPEPCEHSSSTLP